MIVTDKYGIILQHRPDLPNDPNYPDNYDSCMKTCIAHLSGIDCASPVVFYKDGYVVRHPDLSHLLSSRDQLIAFMAAMYFAGYRPRVNYRWFINKDFLGLPHIQWFLRTVRGEKIPVWLLAKEWSALEDIKFMCKYKPDHELNQAFCITLTLDRAYDTDFTKFLCRTHPDWRKNLRDYWGTENSFRFQPEVGEAFIKRIEQGL